MKDIKKTTEKTKVSSPLRVATWNVNSIRARLDHVLHWLEEGGKDVDILCVQETKVKDEQFPFEPFLERGWAVTVFGQPAYNGVAFISKEEPDDIKCGLTTGTIDFSTQKRVIRCCYKGVHIINVYAPNGQTPDSEKFIYKQHWYAALRNLLDTEYTADHPLLICGDFNIAPEARDIYDPEKYSNACMFHPLEREWLKHLMDWGLTDSFRLHNNEDAQYSWWDYREFKFRRNMGIRIDHILVTRPLADVCTNVTIDKAPRKLEKPSDHTPVIGVFEVEGGSYTNPRSKSYKQE